MSYQRERKTPTNNFCECGGTVYHIFKEKRLDHGGGFPMQIKSMGVCECGSVHWKDDLTNLAKEDWNDYVLESSLSMREYSKWKRMLKDKKITKEQFDRRQRNAEKGAGW